MTSIIILSILIIIQLVIIIKFRVHIVSILSKKVDYSNLCKLDLFSPDVIEVYLLAIEHPEKFIFGEYLVNIPGKDFSIWHRNGVLSRGFYASIDQDMELVKDMNFKLTYYDKHLLDKLCTAVKEGQTKTLEIFFDIKS